MSRIARPLRALCLLGMVSLSPREAQALLLGSFTTSLFQQDFVTLAPVTEEPALVVHLVFGPRFCPGHQPPPPTCVPVGDPAPLFDGLTLTSSDAGSVFVATASSDPGFGAVLAYLTNGVNDRVSMDWGPTQSSNPSLTGFISTEAIQFFGDNSGANGTDFAAYAIDSIELVPSLDFDLLVPSANRIRPAGTISVRVIGHLPEPSSGLLLALGLSALTAASRCRSRPSPPPVAA